MGNWLTNIKELLSPFDIDAPSIEVQDLVLDSREVAIHKAFLAIGGHQLDGRDFIPQAVSLGAKAIIAETDDVTEHGKMEMREQSLIVSFYQLPQKLSAIAERFYNMPAQSLDLVAVTGTNGKTSTAHLSSQLRQLLGDKSGTIGTLGAGEISRLEATLNTTPDAINIQRLLSQMHSEQVKFVSFEASSHALIQHRINSLKTDVAIFSNLSRDHLDYHGTMEEYAAAKRMLVHQPGLKWLILNQHDAESENWLKVVPDGIEAVFFGFDKPAYQTYKYCIAEEVEYSSSGCKIKLQTSWGDCIVETRLLGRFNVLNLVSAIGSQLCLGKSILDIASVSNKLTPIAGRMEIFKSLNSPAVVVDYAHTPDALKQALEALRAHTKGSLWCVFGCGGERDKGKRPLMGSIAEQFSDRIIVTNDNSRSEDPTAIAEDIISGCKSPNTIEQQMDRKLAIKQALMGASTDDLILVAGKGHEDYQEIGGRRLAYDERHYVEELLKGTEQ